MASEARPATIAHEAVELVQRWLAESARRGRRGGESPGSRGRTPGRGAQRPRRARLRGRVRRRGRAPAGPASSPATTCSGWPAHPALPALVPCGSRSGSAVCSVPCCRGWSFRSPGGCSAAWSATWSSMRRPRSSGRRSRSCARPASRGARPPAQPQPPRRGGARREGGVAPTRGHPDAAGPRRRRLRVDQGVVDRVASSRCGRSTRRSSGWSSDSRRSTSSRRHPRRRSSSTSTWRSTATST